jgi:ribonuclease R
VAEDFPAEVLEAAGALPDRVLSADRQGRVDLRDLHFVTIDPLTARDFDDAVAVEPMPDDSVRVWVAVADVSHYVAPDSPLDREARARGCSVYLPDRAIPMLPPSLSSEICSLVPRRDRLAMVVRLDVDPEGNVVSDACEAAVIHSQGRLDYGSVAAALQGDFRGRRQTYREHAELLDLLRTVTSALHRRRLKRGGLDLDLAEAQVLLDQDDPNRVRDVVQAKPNTPIKQAYNLVEELMIAANEAVGRRFQRADLPTIWRVHPKPRVEALATLRGWMEGYGVQVPQNLATKRAVARLASRLEGHRAQRALSYLVLRTLKQASYGVSNPGHFGLASPAYLHFTSPIRRYPDLWVHRLLKGLLRAQGLPGGGAAVEGEELMAIAHESSLAERRAIEVERDVHRVYAASLVRDRINDETWGTISGVNTFGFFVTLDHPFVEGLVKLETLEERLELLPEQLRLVERGGTGRVFSLGDRVLVRVVDTNVLRRQVDLRLVEGETSHEPDPAAKNLVWQPAPQRDKTRGGRQRRGRDTGGYHRKASPRGKRSKRRR